MSREQHIIRELTRLCRLAEIATDQPVVKIERTEKGFTNHTYRVHLQNGDKVMARVAGEGTDAYIDRKAEHHNFTQMTLLGIAPQILYCSEETGNNLTKFIDAETMTEEDFQNDPVLRGKVAAAMRTYHQSGLKFANDFSPIERIRESVALLEDSGFICDYEGYDEMVRCLKITEKAFASASIPAVPCHNDPLPANFMYDGDKLTIIDWEFSGMNDCFYDLAAFLVTFQPDKSTEEEFLTGYCNHRPTPHERARLLLNKFLVDAFEVYWTLLQLNAGKDHDLYHPYGKERLDRALSYTKDPFFEEALAEIRKK